MWWRITNKYYVDASKPIREDADGQSKENCPLKGSKGSKERCDGVIVSDFFVAHFLAKVLDFKKKKRKDKNRDIQTKTEWKQRIC